MTGTKITAKAVDVGPRVPDYILPPRAPSVLAYGVGVDSTALFLWRIDNLIWRWRLKAASSGRREPLISSAESVLDSPVASENR